MARRSRRLLCLLLVAAICLTALQFTAVADDTAKKVTDEDVMAGLASPSELYPEIDKTTVPDIIGAEEAVKKGHIKRLTRTRATILIRSYSLTRMAPKRRIFTIPP